MALPINATLGDLPFHAVQLPNGLNIPRIHMERVTPRGMAGSIWVWTGRFADPSTVIGVTYLTAGDGGLTSSTGYYDTAFSYIGTVQPLTITSGLGIGTQFTAKVIDVQFKWAAAHGMEANTNIRSESSWTLELALVESGSEIE